MLVHSVLQGQMEVISNEVISVKYCVCVCVCIKVSGLQNVCSVLYCHLWPVWLCQIFLHYLKKWLDFLEKISEHVFF